MVFVKATFQSVVRKFSISDDCQYDELRKKIIEIFPELEGTPPESLVLFYRDSDNDFISISSNEELHTAGQSMGEDNTLKLVIGVKTPEEKKEDEEENELFDMIVLSPFNDTFNPFSHQPVSLFDHSPFTNLFSLDFPSWSDRRRHLREQEERVRRRREYEERIRKAHLEHMKEVKERTKRAAEERRRRAVVKRKQNEGGKVTARDNGQPVLPKFPPGWTVNPCGSWEPVIHKCPGGTTTVWGPWGYTAWYGGDSEVGDSEVADSEKPTEKNESQEESMEEEVKQ